VFRLSSGHYLQCLAPTYFVAWMITTSANNHETRRHLGRLGVLGFLVPVCVCVCERERERETNVLLVGTFFQHSLGNVAITLERCV
jgi:hypothetical protein